MVYQNIIKSKRNPVQRQVISYYSNISRSFSISPIELAKGDLGQHMKAHSGEKPNKYIQCEKAFSHKSTLEAHMMTHTGENPYQCTLCEKAFSWMSNLNQHMMTHTGKKPYQCTLCEKTFSMKSSHD